MKLRHILIVLALNIALFYGGKLIFPLGIAMGDDFGRAQQDQRDNAAPKIEIFPPVGSCDGVPTRNPGHDELPPLALTAGLSFLVGFRIAAWMGKRQIERLTRIWSSPDSVGRTR